MHFQKCNPAPGVYNLCPLPNGKIFLHTELSWSHFEKLYWWITKCLQSTKVRILMVKIARGTHTKHWNTETTELMPKRFLDEDVTIFDYLPSLLSHFVNLTIFQTSLPPPFGDVMFERSRSKKLDSPIPFPHLLIFGVSATCLCYFLWVFSFMQMCLDTDESKDTAHPSANVSFLKHITLLELRNALCS